MQLRRFTERETDHPEHRPARDHLHCGEGGGRDSAFDAAGKILRSDEYYSLGGGFIASAEELTTASICPESSRTTLVIWSCSSARRC